MIRYSKYFLQSALWLDDGFCEYYVQDDFWGLQEILDVETLVFFWPEDALQWLAQCAEYDHAGTLYHLRDYLAHHSLRSHMLHRMDDARVMQAAAEELTENMSRVVIQPCAGWAVQFDKHTDTAEIPPRVEPEPELSEMLAELKGHLDAIVIEQQEKSARTEAQLANLTPEQKALFYSKKAGTGAYDGVVGGTWDMVKAAPSVLWSAAKAFPGFYVGYLKTLWKVAQTPSKMASLTAQGMATGNYNPLKQEIDRIVTPVAATYEEALKYKSMLTLLFGNEQVYALLYDFAQRYYDATHPAELTEMAASAVADIVVTVILAIVTAGAGAAASVAAKSGRLVKVAKLLEKIAATLKRIGPRAKFLDKGHDAASTAARVEKKAAKAARKKGVPDVDHPKPSKNLDKKTTKDYKSSEKDGDPKTKKKTRGDADREKINNLVKAGKIDEAREIVRPFMEKGQWDEVVERLDVSSPKDGAVFWSGAKPEASNYAKDLKLPNGQKAVTIEDTTGGQILDNWKDWDKKGFSWDGSNGDPPPHIKDLWSKVSSKYAKNATGKVYSLQTADKLNNPKTIWNTVERPILEDRLADGLVSEITIIEL
jgi:hypothetical protein